MKNSLLPVKKYWKFILLSVCVCAFILLNLHTDEEGNLNEGSNVYLGILILCAIVLILGNLGFLIFDLINGIIKSPSKNIFKYSIASGTILCLLFYFLMPAKSSPSGNSMVPGLIIYRAISSFIALSITLLLVATSLFAYLEIRNAKKHVQK